MRKVPGVLTRGPGGVASKRVKVSRDNRRTEICLSSDHNPGRTEANKEQFGKVEGGFTKLAVTNPKIRETS